MTNCTQILRVECYILTMQSLRAYLDENTEQLKWEANDRKKLQWSHQVRSGGAKTLPTCIFLTTISDL
jgi:hypothetical protein